MTDNLNALLAAEFLNADQLFQNFEYSVISLLNSTKSIPEIEKPGVYVYHENEKVWKIGKSNSNVKKRSLEHIRDNTDGKMASLKDDKNMFINFIVLKNVKKIHWVYAIEVFLESHFRDTNNLEIHSARF